MGERKESILLLEDLPADSELIEREISQAGINFELRRVETKEQFEAALQTLPSVILSDYKLPAYDGLAAMKLARTLCPDIPFIFVSGAIGEEKAIETLTSGATDYVLKNKLARLGPAVRRAIEEAALRRAHRRLEQEVVEIPIREQLRIGRDLHDVVGQNLMAIAFIAKVLEQKLVDAASPEASDAAIISSQARETLQQVRAIVHGLCPVEMNQEGLMSALAGLAENVRCLFKIECYFDCQRAVLVPDLHKAAQLYYIAQESVNIALKQARAKAIKISLKQTGQQILLTVRGDGSAPLEKPETDGMGIDVMQYRARMIGGYIQFHNTSCGAEIECFAPFNGFDASQAPVQLS